MGYPNWTPTRKHLANHIQQRGGMDIKAFTQWIDCFNEVLTLFKRYFDAIVNGNFRLLRSGT
jgi:hypothetical protein